MMKIYDCFQFFDENMMLDLRLNILDKYIHKFVIVENLFLHSGEKKKQNFDIENFKKFKDKIIYILVDKLPDGLHDLEKITKNEKNNRLIDNTLKIEHNQRNKISDGLKDADEDDLIVVSDIDEIPKFNSVETSEIKNNILIFEQKMFYYKFNLIYEGFKWFGSKATRKKHLISSQWLRDIKAKKYSKLRFDTFFSKKKYNNIKFINDGGWHFTNIRSPKELHYKLMNFGHHVDYKESGLNVEKIDKIMNSKKVLYDHSLDKTKNSWNASINLKRVENTILPSYLVNNISKYKLWFDKNG